MKDLDFKAVVYREGKYFVAQCLDVEVSSFGDSEQGALKNLQEALELYLEDAPQHLGKREVEQPTIHTVHLQHA